MHTELAPPRTDVVSRRDRILAETLRIVGERGYHGFGIQELAQRCGLTKPGLLHHFGSKDQLLLALLDDIDAKDEAALGAAFGSAFDEAADPSVLRALFRQSMRAVVERSLRNAEIVRLRVVLRVEAMNPDHPAHAYFADRETATSKRLEKGAAAFSKTPRATTRLILAMLCGLEEQWLREDCGFDFLTEWDHALMILIPEISGEGRR